MGTNGPDERREDPASDSDLSDYSHERSTLLGGTIMISGNLAQGNEFQVNTRGGIVMMPQGVVNLLRRDTRPSSGADDPSSSDESGQPPNRASTYGQPAKLVYQGTSSNMPQQTHGPERTGADWLGYRGSVLPSTASRETQSNYGPYRSDSSPLTHTPSAQFEGIHGDTSSTTANQEQTGVPCSLISGCPLPIHIREITEPGQGISNTQQASAGDACAPKDKAALDVAKGKRNDDASGTESNETLSARAARTG